MLISLNGMVAWTYCRPSSLPRQAEDSRRRPCHPHSAHHYVRHVRMAASPRRHGDHGCSDGRRRITVRVVFPTILKHCHKGPGEGGNATAPSLLPPRTPSPPVLPLAADSTASLKYQTGGAEFPSASSSPPSCRTAQEGSSKAETPPPPPCCSPRPPLRLSCGSWPTPRRPWQFKRAAPSCRPPCPHIALNHHSGGAGGGGNAPDATVLPDPIPWRPLLPLPAAATSALAVQKGGVGRPPASSSAAGGERRRSGAEHHGHVHQPFFVLGTASKKETRI